jgi:hypothetical protein
LNFYFDECFSLPSVFLALKKAFTGCRKKDNQQRLFADASLPSVTLGKGFA